MSEENKVLTPDEDYSKNFMPAVHRIGRSTMGIAIILSFLPVAFFVVVLGYGMPISRYLTVAAAIASLGIGMWISEPIAYWPVLGSAGTYIAYLSGNVGAMRFPVALSVQSNMKTNINSPRGQVITIIGIVSSVIAKLVLLVLIVFGGEWLVSVLPEVVMGAFGFVMVTLFGAMWCMRFDGEKGLVSGFLDNLPYIIIAVGLYKIIQLALPVLYDWGLLLAYYVVLCYLIYYIEEDLAKAEK